MRKIEKSDSKQSIDEGHKSLENKQLVIVLRRLTDADLMKAGVVKEIPIKSTNKTKCDELAVVPVQSEFVMHEIVWAKIKGSSHWPARIENIIASSRGCTKYVVFWYNDYRRSVIFKSQAYKFLENFEKFAVKFDDIIGLKTAAFEAMYQYRQRMIKN